MGYVTSVRVLDSQGRPTKAKVTCGGKSRGFTNQQTGELHFEMYSNDRYDVSASRYGTKARGQMRGGQSIVLRL